MISEKKGWIGVDLDGTLAEYHGWVSEDHIGNPISAMVNRVQKWRIEGIEVRIFTARIDGRHNEEVIRKTISDWCIAHIGEALPITCKKDWGMIELWDDRAVRVIFNQGTPCCNHRRKQ